MTKYPVDTQEYEDVRVRFTYHQPHADQAERYERIRNNGLAFACELLETCPSSRERSLALTKLEEVVMYANAAIARREP